LDVVGLWVSDTCFVFGNDFYTKEACDWVEQRPPKLDEKEEEKEGEKKGEKIGEKERLLKKEGKEEKTREKEGSATAAM